MNPSSQPENQLDNDKDLKKILDNHAVVYSRSTKEYLSGTKTMEQMHKEWEIADRVSLKAVDQYTQSKLKAFAGELEEALGERKKFYFGNKTSIGMMCEEAYVNGQNNIIDSVSKSLKAIKEKYINPQKEES